MRRHKGSSPAGPLPDQASLFDNVYVQGWPRLERFPTNSAPPNVAGIVRSDLLESRSPLLIAGYASLDRIVGWLAECHRRFLQNDEQYLSIRLLLGNEPTPTDREDFRRRSHNLSQEVIDYWLARGISLYHSAEVLSALELLKQEFVSVRTAGDRPIHAKIYVGDAGVTIGSSNFTTSGLQRQIEANVRFTASDGQRWSEARGLAERVWSEGVDFRDGLRDLLEQLLRHVTWQEALARACAEVLEGSWAARLRDSSEMNEGHDLWPSQEQGIAHALWILEQQGSVLIADATGSGKTLMGTRLIKRVMMRLLRSGRGRDEQTVLMAPPAVLPDWKRHAADCGASFERFSQGYLSHQSTDAGDILLKFIRRAQVLAIDEAHNFLRRSKRTTALFSNIADHVILFTATPVNRGPRDMLAMIDLLGADNLDDDTLKVLNRLWKRRANLRESISADELGRLRQAIRRFTVRRTKLDLNRLVDREPQQYRSSSGRVCRYPEHRPRTYRCHEPERDLELAQEIRALAARLHGLTRLRSRFELPDGLRNEGLTEESYLIGRLRGAAALAAHEIAASLRSSRARLLEHVCGTHMVFHERPELKGAHITVKPGAVDALQRIAGRLPVSRLRVRLPDWLSDSAAHKEACEAEAKIYREIERHAREMSDSRERAKVDLLRDLYAKHNLVLAFDSHLITLADLRHRLKASEEKGDLEVIVATGQAASARRRLYERFRPGSGAKGIVALCSDALAEGVNLQEASVVVMLDMPSVIRVAEQRIGRVDRMNSPHDTVDAYWPLDPPAFALRASERLAERNRFVADHLGANLELPAELNTDQDDPIVDLRQFVAALDKPSAHDTPEAELDDAFASVRSLVEGPQAIVPQSVYEIARGSQARVVSSISVVESQQQFAFVAIAGTEWGAPRWAYLPNPEADPTMDLDQICSALRSQLKPETREREFDTAAANAVTNVLKRLQEREESLLPRAKQRALEQMRVVLSAYRKECADDERRRTVISAILELASGHYDGQAVDRGVLADWWLRAIQPVKVRHLKARARNRPVLIRDLKGDLLRSPLDTSVLEKVFEGQLLTRPLDERVVAAIIGVAT